MKPLTFLLGCISMSYLMGCDSSTGPSSKKDINDYANHYDLGYPYLNEIHSIFLKNLLLH